MGGVDAIERENVGRVLTSGIGCQPCDRTTALKRCGFHRCMAEPQPAAVFAALREIAVR